MKRVVTGVIFSNKGISLIEILLSIVLLAIIVIPFLSLFVVSTYFNYAAGNIVDATYIAQRTMESVYNINASTDQISVALESLVDDEGFIQNNANSEDYEYSKSESGWFVVLQIHGSAFDENYLYKIIVKVYEDNSLEKLEAQLETIMAWDG